MSTPTMDDAAKVLADPKAYTRSTRFRSRTALTPSRPENETAGNEPRRIGTRRTETAVEPRFTWSELGFESP